MIELANSKSKVLSEAASASRSDSLRRSIYPAALGKGLLAVSRVQVARWNRALRDVEGVQERALMAIVQRASRTEIGRKLGLASIRNYDGFLKSVPVGDYDSFSPYIERMRRGEKNLLVPERVRYFGNSSGSSAHGKQKFLPITEMQIGHQRRAGADTLMRFLDWRADSDFLSGFTLGLFPPTTMRREGPVFITSNPALMMTRMPLFTRPAYLPADDIRRMASYDDKLAAIAARYLDHDVRAVTGTTCWFSLLFDKVLKAARVRDPGIRNVREVWPNLSVLLGGGVSADPYLPLLEKQIGGKDVTLVDTYNATEGGIYATSDFSGERGMLMLPHRGTFFEFVSLDARDHPNRSRVPLWAVRRDVPYSIVVTTVSGLYAYEVGDIVRFTSTDPPRIEFMGRLSGCLSVTQELTTHVEIEQAVAYAIGRVPCRTLDFGAAAEVGVAGTSKSRYVLYVEFDDDAAPSSLRDFATAFDEGMCAANRVYREHRTGDVAILAPRVAPLVRGGARKFLEETTRGNVQGKFPRILSDARKAQVQCFVKESSTSP
jgi:hypothetical protein